MKQNNNNIFILSIIIILILKENILYASKIKFIDNIANYFDISLNYITHINKYLFHHKKNNNKNNIYLYNNHQQNKSNTINNKNQQDYIFLPIKIKIDNNSCDVIHKLNEYNNRIIFNQLSIKHFGNHDIINCGIGIRNIHKNSLIGYNLFYDGILPINKYYKIGIGTELWKPYIQIGMNSCLNMQQLLKSCNIVNYFNNPLYNYDIYMRNHLYDKTDFSIIIKFQHYLYHKIINKYKNKFYWTLGIEYQPISSMMISLITTTSKEYSKYIRFNISLNYNITPLNTSYSNNKNIKNNLYNFVERTNNLINIDNNIKDINNLNNLKLLNTVCGHSNEIKVFHFFSEEDNKIIDIDLKSKILLNRGGKIIKINNNSILICFPKYDHQKINKFHIPYNVINLSDRSIINKQLMIKIEDLTAHAVKNIESVQPTVKSNEQPIDNSVQNASTNLDIPHTNTSQIQQTQQKNNTNKFTFSPPPPPMPIENWLITTNMPIKNKTTTVEKISQDANKSAFSAKEIHDIRNNVNSKFYHIGTSTHLNKLNDLFKKSKSTNSNNTTTLLTKIIERQKSLGYIHSSSDESAGDASNDEF